MTATERFFKYIAYHTTSAEEESQSPSTARQLQLTRALAEEMEAMGLRDVHVDACGNALGTLPATPGVSGAPVLAFLPCRHRPRHQRGKCPGADRPL